MYMEGHISIMIKHVLSAVLFNAIMPIIAPIKLCIYNSKMESTCINKTKGQKLYQQQAIGWQKFVKPQKKVLIISHHKK